MLIRALSRPSASRRPGSFISRISITTNTRDNWLNAYASFRVLILIASFSPTAAPKRWKAPSSWHVSPDTRPAAMPSRNWWRCKGRITAEGFEPLLENVTFVVQNDVEGLRAAVNANTCAIVLEPIFGEGGILECSEDFLRACRTLADQHQAALIFDEIQCGLGRTGKMFAFQSFGIPPGIVPDIVAIAKPIAAGVPLGAFLSKEHFASAISPGQHGTTFGGGPLACRVGLEYLAIVEEEHLLENVVKVGGYLHQQFEELVSKYAATRETRGRGFIQGLVLDIPARPLVEQALAEGVLFNATQD